MNTLKSQTLELLTQTSKNSGHSLTKELLVTETTATTCMPTDSLYCKVSRALQGKLFTPNWLLGFKTPFKPSQQQKNIPLLFHTTSPPFRAKQFTPTTGEHSSILLLGYPLCPTLAPAISNPSPLK